MSNFELKINLNDLDKIIIDYERVIEGKLIRAIRQGLNLLLQELKKNTPEDTKEMLNSYKVIDVQKRGTNYIGIIGNKADHAIYVEYGRDRVFNYHKPKGSVFYRGVGNRTFQRSLLAVQDKIYKLITDILG